MADAPFRTLLEHRRIKVGTSLFEFDSPGIGHVLAAAGAAFVFIDMEHSGFDYGGLKRMLRYCEAADLPVMVRPPSKAYIDIARALDIGATALMLPMVASAAEAAEIVRCMKYPPQGARGVALGMAHDRYTLEPPAPKLAAANALTVCIALIETAEGVENVEEIAAVEGLDAIWIGHFDLSTSLGVPAEFDNPVYTAAIDRIHAAALSAGKNLGRLVASVEEGEALFAEGVDLICYGTEVMVLQLGLRAAVQALGETAGNREAGA